MQQLAIDFQVHPTQITMWKKQVSSQVAGLFKRRDAGGSGGAEEELRQAYEKIGRLDMELDWLKKSGPCLLNRNVSSLTRAMQC